MNWEDVPREEKLRFAKWMGKRRLRQAVERFEEIADAECTDIPCPACKKADGGCDDCMYPALPWRCQSTRCMHFKRGRRGRLGAMPDGLDLDLESGEIFWGVPKRQVRKCKSWCRQVARDYQELLEMLE